MSLNLTIFLAFSYRFRVPHNVLNNNCHLTCWLSIYQEESRRLSAKTDAVWTGARRCGRGPGSMGGGQAVWTGGRCCALTCGPASSPTPQVGGCSDPLGAEWLGCCVGLKLLSGGARGTPAPTGTSVRGPGMPDPQGPAVRALP